LWIYTLALTGVFIIFFCSCRKDDKDEYRSETGTVIDIDGNAYQTVIIGSMEWMAENLRTTRYNDGSPINYPGTDNNQWENNTTGAYSWYQNDRDTYMDTYGALYNWHAVKTGKLCPAGWRLPTDDDWTEANRSLAANAGGKLKDNNTGYWQGTNSDATNETGFNALPGGGRFSALPGGSRVEVHGYFYYMGKSGRWWTSTEQSSSEAWYRSVHSGSGNLYRSHNYKETGFSVRCVRD
jgi:uncharacterized protein (TIGR02145 family)